MRLIAASLTSIVVLSGLLAWNSQSALSPDVRPIVVYCAVALQPPVEELARKFELETGIPVQVEYGASQVLLTRLELRRDGDLFIPADDDYLLGNREQLRTAERDNGRLITVGRIAVRVSQERRQLRGRHAALTGTPGPPAYNRPRCGERFVTPITRCPGWAKVV